MFQDTSFGSQSQAEYHRFEDLENKQDYDENILLEISYDFPQNSTNLDRILKKLYKYYIGRGLWRIVLKEILTICFISLMMTTFFILTSCIDWHKLMEISENNEVQLGDILMIETNFFIITVLICFGVYLVYKIGILIVHDLPILRKLQGFYKDRLGIIDNDLAFIKWSQIVKKIQDLPNFKLKNNKTLNTLQIAQRILKGENFLVGLFNKGLLDTPLDLHIPLLEWFPLFTKPKWDMPFMNKQFERYLYYCIIEFIFDGTGHLKYRLKTIIENQQSTTNNLNTNNSNNENTNTATDTNTTTNTNDTMDTMNRNNTMDTNINVDFGIGLQQPLLDSLLPERKPSPPNSTQFESIESTKSTKSTQSPKDDLINQFENEFLSTSSTIKQIDISKIDTLVYHGLVNELNNRFVLAAVFNLLLMPLIILYNLFYYLFQYGETIYSHPDQLGTRQWSLAAQWHFREYNELPHLFQTRMRKGSKWAHKYLQQFPSIIGDAVGRIVALFAGGFLIILIFISFLNTHVLTNLNIFGDQSVLWVIGILTAVLAISRGFIIKHLEPPSSKPYLNIVHWVHDLPLEWKDKSTDRETAVALGILYEWRLTTLCRELFGIMVIPFMILKLRKNTESIVYHILENLVYEEEVGWVYKRSTFHFTENSNSSNTSNTSNTSNFVDNLDYNNINHNNNHSHIHNLDVIQSQPLPKRLIYDVDKLKKSMINFKVNNPEWNRSNRSNGSDHSDLSNQPRDSNLEASQAFDNYYSLYKNDDLIDDISMF